MIQIKNIKVKKEKPLVGIKGEFGIKAGEPIIGGIYHTIVEELEANSSPNCPWWDFTC